MAEGDVVVFNDFPKQLALGTHLFGTHVFKAALLAGYTPDIDAHTVWADVSSSEESGTGYTAGGETVTFTVTVDNTNDKVVFDVSNPTWSGLDVGTPSHLVIYNDSAASKNLVACAELGRASNGGDYTAEVNASGLFDVQN